MRFLREAFGCGSAARFPIIVGLAIAVAGCDTQAGRDASDSTIGLFRMMVGSDEDPNALQVDPGAPLPPVAGKCPPVVIREDTGTYRLFERGFEGDPAHVIYQGGITKVARDCEILGPNSLRISIGVAGRVITGPSWNNSPINLPIRAAFVKTGGEAVWTELYNVETAIVPGETIVRFVQVEENLTYDVPEDDHINNYVIYVGFDEKPS